MRFKNGDHIPRLIQAQGLGFALASLLELVRMGLAVFRQKPSFNATNRELAFGIVNGAGGQRLHPNVGYTLDISS